MTALEAGLYGLAAALGTTAVILAGTAASRRGRLAGFLPLVVSLAVLAATTGIASAESWVGFVYSPANYPGSTLDCGKMVRDINNSYRPAMYTKATIVWDRNGARCADYSVAQPPNHITIEQDLWSWNGTNQFLCNRGPTVENWTWTSWIDTGYGWPTLPCTNWYYEFSSLWFRNAFNNFHDGTTTSQWNWIN